MNHTLKPRFSYFLF